MGNTGLMFRGIFDTLPEIANVGDVVMVSGETYVYADGWQEIAKTENYTEIKEPPKNCPNCGGVINPYKLKCEFCGTYW